MADLANKWFCRSIFTLTLKSWKDQKLRRIILFHIGLVTFNYHFPKIENVFIFMIVGPSGHVHYRQNQFFLILDTPKCSKEFKTDSYKF